MAAKVPPIALELPGPVAKQVTPAFAAHLHTRIEGVDAIDGLYLWSDRIVQLIVVLSLIANSVAVKADVAVCVYKARIHVISGDIDLFRIFSRNVFPDFYNLPMFNQKISDKDVLCYRCVKYSVLNANHLKNPPLVLDVRWIFIRLVCIYSICNV